MAKIRIVVIEDSLTVRKRLIEVLSSDPGMEVVGEGTDGRQAIELCRAMRPDVITLDMMLPVMSGLAATEYIMAYCPTPIVIVSASTNRGELYHTYDALAAGAVDVIDKTADQDADWERRLISTVKVVSRVKVITHPRARLELNSHSPHAVAPTRAGEDESGTKSEYNGCQLIAMGASTGGPGAVLDILRALPANFRLPILLVIHIGEMFASAFAEWLDSQSPLRVSYAKNGDAMPAPGKGRVIMAPPERHLILKQGRLYLTSDPARHSCRPSVDVMFASVARELGRAAAGCLLTGMGRDGAAGLLAMRQAGGMTIAQDEATSVVFGMPREAILLGAAAKVLPLPRIAGELMSIVADANSGGAA